MASIEPIGVDEAERVWPLSVEAGWNQNLADWKFMLAAGRAFGLRNAAGVWEASSLVLPLGQRLAWISMVLVTEARRRGGFGTILLKRCIEEAKSSGAVAGLDATEQGRPIYLPLGFHDLYKISRWHLDGTTGAPLDPAVRPLNPSDLPAVQVFDSARSGVERPALLAHLLARQPGRAFCAQTAGHLRGFVLGREGRTASYIGPVIAENESIALALISRAAGVITGPFIIDLPDAHGGIRRWLEGQGAVSPRGYVRMTLGTAEKVADPSHVFALAGPELG